MTEPTPHLQTIRRSDERIVLPPRMTARERAEDALRSFGPCDPALIAAVTKAIEDGGLQSYMIGVDNASAFHKAVRAGSVSIVEPKDATS